MDECPTREQVMTELRTFFEQPRTAAHLLAYLQSFRGWTAHLRAHHPAAGHALLELSAPDTQQRCRFWLLSSGPGETRLRLFAADSVETVEDTDRH